MEGTKRKEPGENGAGSLVVKKQRTDITLAAEQQQQQNDSSKALSNVARTSNLQAPIMLLSGHKAEVFAAKFSPLTGKHIASCSFDKTIRNPSLFLTLVLWNVYGDCESYFHLRGHTSAVLDVQWSTDEGYVFSASADKTLAIWDAETGMRIKKCKGHTSFVNSCHPARRGPQLLVSGSDDCTVKMWDVRVRGAQDSFDAAFPVTAVTFSDQSDLVFSGGLDNDIKVWDLRKNQVLYTLEGHTDSITGLSVSSDGSYLLSNGMDQTVRMWDIRPFCPGSRQVKLFQGLQHNFEKTLLRCQWSPDGSKVAAGSADRFVYVWDVTTRRILYKLPGHRGSVNDVAFHPKEPILASASSDQTLFLGEIKP